MNDTRTRAAVLPVSVAARRKRILSERLDRMEIPRLFPQGCLEVGKPIELPSGLDASGIQACSAHVRAALEAVDGRVERAVRDP